MTQEEKKQLLSIDLCARLPYKVKIKCGAFPNGVVVTGIVGDQVFHTPYFIGGKIIINKHKIDEVRPYLRPMSSMTKAEEEEYNNTFVYKDGFKMATSNSVDFLNSHHFDYRGLIPMGLAIEASKEMYKHE